MLRRRIALFFVFTIMSIAPSTALAVGFVQIVPKDCVTDSSGNAQKGGCQTVCDIAQLAQNFLTDMIYMAVVISAFLFAYAGMMMLTAGDNHKQITDARAVFTNVTIGLVIILVGWLLVDALFSTMTGGHTWNQIC